MQTISLDGVWSLTFFPEGSRVVRNPEELRGSGETVEARGPGNV